MRDAVGAQAETHHKSAAAAINALLRFAEEEIEQIEAQIATAERQADQRRAANTATAMKTSLYGPDVLRPA